MPILGSHHPAYGERSFNRFLHVILHYEKNRMAIAFEGNTTPTFDIEQKTTSSESGFLFLKLFYIRFNRLLGEFFEMVILTKSD